MTASPRRILVGKVTHGQKQSNHEPELPPTRGHDSSDYGQLLAPKSVGTQDGGDDGGHLQDGGKRCSNDIEADGRTGVRGVLKSVQLRDYDADDGQGYRRSHPREKCPFVG